MRGVRINLALIFGAIVAAAIVIDYGFKSAKGAFAGAGASGASGAPVAAGSLGADVKGSAQRWGVPEWILWGVFGVETSHGTNVTTSSAGAEGELQFIPSTAKTYNYPLTNAPNPQQAAAQIDDGAHYLHDLFAQHGSWEAAVRAYSGGGYGLSEVQSHAGGLP